ncbi:MAG: diheme cytochrome c [Rhodospirillales bacterium]|nr:diheme cytochrome c [Rhodospirillales bacterium]
MKTRTLVALLSVALLLPAAALAGGGRKVAPIADPVVAKECGACHMAFQPEFLPARSWEKLMADLANHFGDDASLAPAARERIRAYLVANAAGVAPGKESRKVADSVPANATPLRITETGRWTRKHRPGEVNPVAFTSAKVKSKANCAACHAGAAEGYYED